MRVLQINSVCGIRSTGRICTDIAGVLTEHGHECRIAHGREEVPARFKDVAIRIGTDLDVRLHAARTRLFDDTGFGSRKATERFIEWVKEFDPDVIHLHNIHGYYINIEVLFNYLAVAGKPVVWTLHDCWAFTGHCAHFDYVGCEKWKSHCGAPCPNKGEYPKSLLMDRSYRNFEDKKRLFTSVKNMTIVTPSNWLAGLVRQSFMNKYPIQVIHNGIDLDVFRPTPSDVRQRYGLEEKTMILAVASTWDKRKGYDDLMELAQLLRKDQQLVVVGISEKQKKALPGNVIGILRTNSMQELAEFYTAADVLINPTYEDNFPTVNLEALACGTPVITYDTGGSPECINKKCGLITTKRNPEVLVNAVLSVIAKGISVDNCLESAGEYDSTKKFSQYLSLYDAQMILRGGCALC